VLLWIC